jgi:glycosyltransferase involved in cell wall biosynthesis
MTAAGQRATTGEAQPPFVSVVVPVLNREDTISRCLASVLRGSYPQDRREIVVVDNGSSDHTLEVVAKHPVRLVVERRRGLSQARNRGIDESRGEILAFTDSDCYVATDWLAGLTAGLRDDVAAGTGDVVPYLPATPVERYSARRKPHTNRWVEGQAAPWFNFMNTALRREVFDLIGQFDTRFPGAGEDIDFAWRFFAAGLRHVRLEGPVVFHSQRTTVDGLFRQQVRNGRAWVLLGHKHPHVAGWSWRQELAAWGDLARTSWATARARAGAPPSTRGPVPPEYLHLDLVSKLGQRVGFLDGHLRRRF